MTQKRIELPSKIENRLAELGEMGEFDGADVAHCRATYWSARADWHTILVDCYAAALARSRATTEPRGTAQ